MSRKLPIYEDASGAKDLEFSGEADVAPDALSRRTFLEYLGATIATASAASCAEPAERIVPFSRQPPELTPGIPLHYATAWELDGYAFGLIAEAREGRPIKIEGNPDHPISLGATGPFAQASLLSLYDNQRARGLLKGDTPRPWSAMVAAFTNELGDGEGLHFLMEPTGSPLVEDQIRQIRALYPKVSFHFHSPVTPRGRWEATRALTGRPLMPQYRFDEADVILSLDDDFLTFGPAWLRNARGFAEKRRPKSPRGEMNRLYVAESGFTSTGAKADHRLPLHSRDLAAFAVHVAARIVRSDDLVALSKRLGPVKNERFVDGVVNDLRRAGENGVVLAGVRQPAVVHALALLMNQSLGSIGRTVTYTEDPVIEAGEPSHDLGPLVEAISEEQVKRLVIVGGNPVYTAPADLELERLIGSVEESAYLGLYWNETALACKWKIAQLHYLESWDVLRAADGTITVTQPLIRRLFGGRGRAQLLAAFAGNPDPDIRDLVRQRFVENGQPQVPEALERQPELRSGMEAEAEPAMSSVAPPSVPKSWLADVGIHPRFEQILKQGFVKESGFEPVTPNVDRTALSPLLKQLEAKGEPGIELILTPDGRVHDGRFANIPWLLELPDPITRYCWGNAALFAPATAARLGLKSGDAIRLAVDGQKVVAPVGVFPGFPENTTTLSIGYGRRGEEKFAAGVGVNAFALQLSKQPWFVRGAEIDKLKSSAEELGIMPAWVQEHWDLQGRPIVLSRTLDQYRKNPDFAEDFDAPPLSIHEPWPEVGEQWGMAIDTTTCVGCNACVVACQVENNVPAVGKLNVKKQREMHWLRLDRYFVGEDLENPEVAFQPMLCQHCEKAPCEYVCPVNATVHSPDGLNEMTYNRCVGTRFCSNNCPYKVRRFNWFEFNDEPDPVQRLRYNPDVTVRARGVMEKCTYCVQRIRREQIVAKQAGRAIGDEDLKTACQQVCPADAIVFGNINNKESRVRALHQDKRAYAVLHDTGTRPRTRYLALIRNPNDDVPHPKTPKRTTLPEDDE